MPGWANAPALDQYDPRNYLSAAMWQQWHAAACSAAALDWLLLSGAVFVPLVVLGLVALDRRAGRVPREMELFYSFFVVPACFEIRASGVQVRFQTGDLPLVGVFFAREPVIGLLEIVEALVRLVELGLEFDDAHFHLTN